MRDKIGDKDFESGIVKFSDSEYKTFFTRSIEVALYWVFLFLVIVGNFIISVVLVPFFLVFRGFFLYFSLFFIGLSFGCLFGFILASLERMKTRQHIIWSIFIPALALINVGIFAVLSNKLIYLMKLSTPAHNPMLVGACYVFGYVIPSAILHLKKKF